MFTGIVQAVGRMRPPRRAATVCGSRSMPAGLDVGDVGIGDSIAMQRVLPDRGGEGGRWHWHARLAFDVSAETLRCTAGLEAPPTSTSKRRCASPTGWAGT